MKFVVVVRVSPTEVSDCLQIGSYLHMDDIEMGRKRKRERVRGGSPKLFIDQSGLTSSVHKCQLEGFVCLILGLGSIGLDFYFQFTIILLYLYIMKTSRQLISHRCHSSFSCAYHNSYHIKLGRYSSSYKTKYRNNKKSTVKKSLVPQKVELKD